MVMVIRNEERGIQALRYSGRGTSGASWRFSATASSVTISQDR
jgi:hypothetical protein